MRVKDKSLINKLIVAFTPMTINFKVYDARNKTLGSKHIMHGDTYYTVSKVILILSF
jgi:hypothetical protein